MKCPECGAALVGMFLSGRLMKCEGETTHVFENSTREGLIQLVAKGQAPAGLDVVPTRERPRDGPLLYEDYSILLGLVWAVNARLYEERAEHSELIPELERLADELDNRGIRTVARAFEELFSKAFDTFNDGLNNQLEKGE